MYAKQVTARYSASFLPPSLTWRSLIYHVLAFSVVLAMTLGWLSIDVQESWTLFLLVKMPLLGVALAFVTTHWYVSDIAHHVADHRCLRCERTGPRKDESDTTSEMAGYREKPHALLVAFRSPFAQSLQTMVRSSCADLLTNTDRYSTHTQLEYQKEPYCAYQGLLERDQCLRPLSAKQCALVFVVQCVGFAVMWPALTYVIVAHFNDGDFHPLLVFCAIGMAHVLTTAIHSLMVYAWYGSLGATRHAHSDQETDHFGFMNAEQMRSMIVKCTIAMSMVILALFMQVSASFCIGYVLFQSRDFLKVWICIGYPIAIGGFKWALRAILAKVGMFHNIVVLISVEVLSLGLAAVPYRFIFLALPDCGLFAIVLGVELGFKLIKYPIRLSTQLWWEEMASCLNRCLSCCGEGGTNSSRVHAERSHAHASSIDHSPQQASIESPQRTEEELRAMEQPLPPANPPAPFSMNTGAPIEDAKMSGAAAWDGKVVYESAWLSDFGSHSLLDFVAPVALIGIQAYNRKVIDHKITDTLSSDRFEVLMIQYAIQIVFEFVLYFALRWSLLAIFAKYSEAKVHSAVEIADGGEDTKTQSHPRESSGGRVVVLKGTTLPKNRPNTWSYYLLASSMLFVMLVASLMILDEDNIAGNAIK